MKDLLRQSIDRFAGAQVVVWCDLVLDEFLYGQISRVSREAPVLILDYDHRSTMPGGGANAIENLRALGASPLPIGVVGKDEAGDRLLDWMNSSGIETGGVTRLADHTTPSKSRVLAGLPHCRPQQIVRIDRGTTPQLLPPDLQTATRGKLQEALSADATRALLISDYGYGLITPGSVPAVLTDARQFGIPVTCDSRHQLGKLNGMDAVTPNLEEVEGILGESLGEDTPKIIDGGQKLLRMLACKAVLITLGRRGMVLMQEGIKSFQIPVYGSDEVADVTGAGDTVIATFTLAMATGATLLQAALLANCAAGLVVMKHGTATVTAAELKAAIEISTPTFDP